VHARPRRARFACAPRITAAGEPVTLNFQNAEIDSVIQAIGRISGRNFLIDPRVKGKINIITNTPVAPDLTYQILLSALRLQGYAAIEEAGVTKLVPEADAKLHGVPVVSGRQGAGGARGDRLVTQVFALRHESAATWSTWCARWCRPTTPSPPSRATTPWWSPTTPRTCAGSPT
jgi:general secretion pathway protein D